MHGFVAERKGRPFRLGNFQDDPEFYHRFIAEIHLFLKLHPNTVDWMAVVLFPKRSIEPSESKLFRNLINSDQVHRIYLEDLSASNDSVGLGLMRLIVMKPKNAIAQAQILLSKVQQRAVTDSRLQVIIELIETVIVYKFPKLSREEIEKMLGLSELRQTRVYQEGVEEGEERGILKGRNEGRTEGRTEGRVEEAQSLILRQLTRRIGNVSSTMRSQVSSLSLHQLESLGEALLDFTSVDDLEHWLRLHS
jgi:predicted transposase/invertase (TIGR01784 family)